MQNTLGLLFSSWKTTHADNASLLLLKYGMILFIFIFLKEILTKDRSTSVRKTLESSSTCLLERCEVKINGVYFQDQCVWLERRTQSDQQDTQLVECCCIHLWTE